MNLQGRTAFLRCIRHVPAQQLLRRLWLTAKRRWIVSPAGAPFRVRRAAVLPCRAQPPVRRFPPRTELIDQTAEGSVLVQLNQRYPLVVPMDWVCHSRPDATHLERLTLHYHDFLESVEADEGIRLVQDWIAANPPWQSGYWLDNWNSYAISIRCVTWMQWLAEQGHILSPAEADAIVASLVEQIRFLEGNLETDIRGNHLVRNIRCQMWAGRFFECREADRWWATGTRLLERELVAQLLPDGMHVELSPAYHCQVLADLLDIAGLYDDSSRAGLLQRLESSVQAMLNLTHPDGFISLFSDGGLHMAVEPQTCYGVWRQLGGRELEPDPVVRLTSGGYYGIRSSDGDFLLIDCGPCCAKSLPAHGHGDMLAFEWDVAGHRVIVDAGVSQYEAGEVRSFERSVRSHNTVSVGSRDQAEFLGSFRTGRRGTAVCDRFEVQGTRLLLTGHHDGFSTASQTVTHTRMFDASPGHVRVRDSVTGAEGESCVARLLLHPACRVRMIDAHQVSIGRDRGEILLRSDSPLKVVPGTWAPDFGQLVPATRIEIDYGASPCDGGFELRVLSRPETCNMHGPALESHS